MFVMACILASSIGHWKRIFWKRLNPKVAMDNSKEKVKVPDEAGGVVRYVFESLVGLGDGN
jgi:hypothetical protein